MDQNIIGTIIFALGVIIGGIVSNKAFKRPKNLSFEILEIIIFYLVIFILETRIEYLSNYFIFGIIGFLSSIVARASSSKLIFIKEKVDMKRKTSKYGLLIGLKNSLRRRGFDAEEIKKLAKELGFDDSEIKKVIK